MSEKYKEARKELATAILHRIENLGIEGKAADKVARNMLIGASSLALIQNEKDLVHYLHSSFTDLVEFGMKLVYKWANVTIPVEEEEETTKEAA